MATICEGETAFLLTNKDSPAKEPRKVPVKFDRDEDAKLWPNVFNSSGFQQWVSRYAEEGPLQLNGLTIKKVESEEGVVTTNIEADIIKTSSGEKLNGKLKLNEPKIGVLLVVRTQAAQRDQFVFIRQNYATMGNSQYYELPIGSFNGEGDFIGPYATKLTELFGSINKNSIVDLTASAFRKQSPGRPLRHGIVIDPQACDSLQVFLVRKTLEAADYTKIVTQLEEKEFQQYKFVSVGDAWASTCDARLMAAMFLFHELRFHNQMPKLPESGRFNVDAQNASMQKASFMQIADLEPTSRAFNLLVKVLTPAAEVEGSRKDSKSGRGMLRAVIGDGSGCIKMRVHGEQLALLERTGASLVIRNAIIEMEDGYMHLAVKKWGKVCSGEPNDGHDWSFEVDKSNDISQREYEVAGPADGYENEMNGVHPGGMGNYGRGKGGRGGRGRYGRGRGRARRIQQ